MVGHEVLRQSNERIVDGLVAVRMVLPQHLAHDASTLPVPALGGEVEHLHGVEHAAVDGFEAGPHIGQGAAEDGGHGVGHERGLQLLDELRRLEAIDDHRIASGCLALVTISAALQAGERSPYQSISPQCAGYKTIPLPLKCMYYCNN